MKNRHALNFVLAATLLSMTVLTVDIPFVRAIEWSSETQLTTHPNHDRSPSIMQASDGTIWVVWASERLVLNEELYYKTSSNHGLNWSPDTRLTQALGHDSGPSIMQDSNGTIWVAWASTRTGNYELVYNTLNEPPPWSSHHNITYHPSDDIGASIMQASNGTIWVVWYSNRFGNFDLFCKTSDDGSAWSNETRLTYDDSDDNDPSIVQLSNGTIWVVWSSFRTGNHELFYKIFNGTAWSSYTQLTDDLDYYHKDPSIAQARDGTIWVVWQAAELQYQDDLWFKVYNGSTWSSDAQLTTNLPDDIASSIVQINDRSIWVVWAEQGEAENFDIYYITTVVVPGDVNGDGTVDITDLTLVGEAYGTVEGDPDYNLYADLNCDDIIDIYDLAECGKNYG